MVEIFNMQMLWNIYLDIPSVRNMLLVFLLSILVLLLILKRLFIQHSFLRDWSLNAMSHRK